MCTWSPSLRSGKTGVNLVNFGFAVDTRGLVLNVGPHPLMTGPDPSLSLSLIYFRKRNFYRLRFLCTISRELERTRSGLISKVSHRSLSDTGSQVASSRCDGHSSCRAPALISIPSEEVGRRIDGAVLPCSLTCIVPRGREFSRYSSCDSEKAAVC